MTNLVGNWRLETNENIDQYMKTIGVGFFLRKLANKITSYEEIKQDGEFWEIHFTSTFKNDVIRFKLGELFEEETMDGKTVKTVMSVDGGKLIQYQNGVKEGDLDREAVRELQDEDTMTVTFTAVGTGISAKRIFKRYTK
ncbi:sodium/calcium exchanger regulatory protein 1-like [Gigantopelta aegis]|uniref:sodium/calcium exchanger regulatory protein 1-like n=1 Tax=Gigantopelta aegis TaxID=1735272 RepID=UPI001B88770A|nr:sodium/calcium exchanger regulatory protein 1-like [Gigantopelta aegis]